MTHLSDATMRQYRERTLTPDALLDASVHLAECAACRASASPRLDGLLEALTEESLHLDADQLAPYVDGTLTRFERAPIEDHLATCASCAEDVADLRRTADAIAPRPQRRISSAAAAAVAAVVLLPIAYFTFFNRSTDPIPQTPVAVVDVEADRLLREARAGKIEIASRALAMRRSNGALMGSDTSTFDVVAPAGTFVRETRPRFSWKASTPAASYRVEIYENGTLVAQSPLLQSLAWQSDRDLVRGHEYIWQVVATEGSQRTIAPQPPASEARFAVLDASAVARVNDADRKYATQPLVRVLIAAREGLLDEARAALATFDGNATDAPAAQSLRDQLQ